MSHFPPHQKRWVYTPTFQWCADALYSSHLRYCKEGFERLISDLKNPQILIESSELDLVRKQASKLWHCPTIWRGHLHMDSVLSNKKANVSRSRKKVSWKTIKQRSVPEQKQGCGGSVSGWEGPEKWQSLDTGAQMKGVRIPFSTAEPSLVKETECLCLGCLHSFFSMEFD